jgi:hypothetical protein
MSNNQPMIQSPKKESFFFLLSIEYFSILFVLRYILSWFVIPIEAQAQISFDLGPDPFPWPEPTEEPQTKQEYLLGKQLFRYLPIVSVIVILILWLSYFYYNSRRKKKEASVKSSTSRTS